MRRLLSVVAIFWGFASADLATADGPADPLLRLVDPDSGATLVVEDLRSRRREISGSPLFEGLMRTPPVRAWIASDPYRRAEGNARNVLDMLEVSFGTIRDDLFGDAVVLTLQPGPSGKPDQARGMILVRPRDRPMLERLIALVNQIQVQSGELDGADPRARGTVPYWARLFKGGKKPPEFYTILDDGTFAWSNSESMIHGVVDRKLSGRGGLGDVPRFRQVRDGLPARSLASLFVNARFLEATMADQPRDANDRLGTLLSRYVQAVGMVGVGVDWRDGVFLHSCETVDPAKLDPWLRDWLTRPSTPTNLPAQVSPGTIALASANLDFRSIVQAYRDTTPVDDRPGLENLKTAFQGLLMGRDPMTEVLPRLQSGAVLALEIEPDQRLRPHFPLVAAVSWSVAPGLDDLAGPIANAMKTFLALQTLGPKRKLDHLRVESREIGNSRLTVLTDGLKTRLAYRVDSDHLVIGNSPEAVARFGTGQPPSAINDIRVRMFPGAETFAIVDLARVVAELQRVRGPLAKTLADRSKRPIAEVNREVRDFLSIADLFKAATFTSNTIKDASEVRRTVGLMAR
jgi:hypothetical protein